VATLLVGPVEGGEEQAMSYDLVIKNGWVVDGSGCPGIGATSA